MLLQILPGDWNRRKVGHGLYVLLRSHFLAIGNQAGQQLEVIDVESRRERVEELGLLIKRVGECVRRARGNRDKVSNLCVNVGLAWDVEANRSLSRKEHLIMHLVPMGGWSTNMRWQSEFSAANAIVYTALASRSFFSCVLRLACVRSVFHYTAGNGTKLDNISSFCGNKRNSLAGDVDWERHLDGGL
jgi:hypothetical protein